MHEPASRDAVAIARGGSRNGALIYVRVSTDEQAEKGYSLDAQEDACRRFALERGAPVLSTYRDEGQSATTTARPKFRELLARCADDNAVGFVIVIHTDRFARNLHDHLTLKTQLKRQGVQLISVQQPLLDDSPEGTFMDAVLASMNEFYSRDIGRKISKGTARKVAEGGWPRQAPLGYRNVRDANTGKANLETDPATGPVVAEAFARFATGEHTTDDLADFLLDNSVRARTGGRVSRNGVIHMLRNAVYVGRIPWKGGVLPGMHAPLTDAETFAACERVLQVHGRGIDRRRKHEFLLANVVRCERCGTALSGELHRKRSGKVFSYYRCLGTRQGRDKCPKRFVPATQLEESVRAWLLTVHAGPRFERTLRTTLEAVRKSGGRTAKVQLKALENRRDRIEENLRRLEDLMITGAILPERGRGRTLELAADLERVITQIKEAREPELAIADEDIERALSFVDDLGRFVLDGASPAASRRFVRSVLAEAWVCDGRVERGILTPALEALVSCNAVRISESWRTIRDLIRTPPEPREVTRESR
jgi:site-specific DNA recombinase